MITALLALVAVAAIVRAFGHLLESCVVGAKTTRPAQRPFFLEPYLWLLIAVTMFRAPLKERTSRWTLGAISAQAVLALVMIAIGVTALTPGALTLALREKTMDHHAYGYAVMRWADGMLPPDAYLVVELRSIALAPRFAIANDWRGYVPANKAQVYTDAVKRQQPDFTLVQVGAGKWPDVPGCAEVFPGPFRTRQATRNPFNSGVEYDAWIIRHYTSKNEMCLQGESVSKRKWSSSEFIV